jgi:hypothetical protein
MKKILLFLVMIPGILEAQDKGIGLEIEGSYGVLSSAQILTVTRDVFVEIITLGTAVDKDNYHSTGAGFLSGRYYVNSWLGVGLTLGMEIIKADLVNGEDVIIGDYTYRSQVIAAEFKFRYLNTEFLQLYSGLGSGFRFGKEKTRYLNDPPDISDVGLWTGHINLLGIRIGKGFGGFLELGYGYKGIFNVGISCHL